eukprot:364070_1
MLSTSKTVTTECEVIVLNITIQSHNYSLYNLIQSNPTKFTNILRENVYNYYQEHEELIVYQFRSLFRRHNDSLTISFNVTNCDFDIRDLNQYFNSSIFNTTLTKHINAVYYDDHEATIKDVSTKRISFLPPPILYTNIFSINNPLTIIFLSILGLLMLVVLVAFCQSKYFEAFSKLQHIIHQHFGFKKIDNFNPVRVMHFVTPTYNPSTFAVFISFNNFNSSYAYFYGYTIHNDFVFLFCAVFSLIMALLTIIFNGLLIKSLEYDHDEKYLETWLNKHKFKLIFLIVISASFFFSLSLVNSNLFGFGLFSMKFSNKKLFQYRVYGWHFIALSFLQLIVHTFAIFYIVSRSQYIDDQDDIKYVTIISIICGIFNVLMQLVVKCSSPYFQYETTNIDIRIESDDDDDIITLQKQKDLTRNIK